MAKRKSKGRPAWGWIIGVLVVCAALGAVWKFTPLNEYVTADAVRQWARELRNVPWAPYALALAYTPAAFIMFPQPPMTLFAVLAFGPLAGMASAVCGKLLAALATYACGRFLNKNMLDKLSGGRTKDAQAIAREHGVMAVVAANFAPLPPFAVQGMIAGGLKMPLWQYLLGTFLAAVPGVLAAGFFAHELLQAMSEENGANWWMIGLSVCLLFALPLLARRWVRQRQKKKR